MTDTKFEMDADFFFFVQSEEAKNSWSVEDIRKSSRFVKQK
jgi:hypothetical protein